MSPNISQNTVTSLGARHYLIDMASALVLLDLIRHPEEVSSHTQASFTRMA